MPRAELEQAVAVVVAVLLDGAVMTAGFLMDDRPIVCGCACADARIVARALLADLRGRCVTPPPGSNRCRGPARNQALFFRMGGLMEMEETIPRLLASAVPVRAGVAAMAIRVGGRGRGEKS